jgi:Fe-Mn family superoxide dismutase
MEVNIALSRRKFLASAGLGAAALGLSALTSACNKEVEITRDDNLYPIYNGTEYLVKDFSHLTKNSALGLSPEIVSNHIGLYKGYVEKVNKAEAMMRSNEVDEFSLQHLAFSLNGMALHDIYFTNMSTEKTNRTQALNKAIEESFGDFNTYYSNLVNIAERVQGWSITGLNLLNGKLLNYGEDTHSSNFPNYFMPILALDVYDHAYVMDFGAEGKTEYINAWTKVIDWDVVSRRYDVIKTL